MDTINKIKKLKKQIRDTQVKMDQLAPAFTKYRELQCKMDRLKWELYTQTTDISKIISVKLLTPES